MAEWLFEQGIGENRALLADKGHIIEARIERPDSVLPGDIWNARVRKRLSPARAIVGLGETEAILEPPLRGVAEGGLARVEVVRAAIPERGRPRLPKVRGIAPAEGPPGLVLRGPDLAAELAARPEPVRGVRPPGPDLLEAAGWSELVDQARSGLVPFGGGLLTISPTPAMTLIDVDGDLPPAELAVLGAAAAAEAILRFDIGGSIGIDLPTAASREARKRAAEAVDVALPQPFERTAVNGFGFLQIVRPRRRASLIEFVQNAPTATAALALLRQAERAPGSGARRLTLSPAAARWLAERQALLRELERRIGARVVLNEDPQLPLWGGHVTAHQN